MVLELITLSSFYKKYHLIHSSTYQLPIIDDNSFNFLFDRKSSDFQLRGWFF